VDRILTAYPGLEQNYGCPGKVTAVGTPVRGGFGLISRRGARQALGIGDEPLVVSFWGSLGAARMNEITAEFIKLNSLRRKFRHIHGAGSGPGGYGVMIEKLRGMGLPKLPDGIEVRPYIDDMATVMTAADLIICRAGASTLAELSASGAPAVLVPSPYVPGNHQAENARALSVRGAAEIVSERGCTAELLFGKTVALLEDADTLGRLSNSIRSLASRDAAEKIAGIIISMCKG
jgi:UDP-N-acetylglucosamine--N-acetylmuramyl-(pentapeptide) pyrophosphoryl-undecaprenol N-acetylglucosamine transferase